MSKRLVGLDCSGPEPQVIDQHKLDEVCGYSTTGAPEASSLLGLATDPLRATSKQVYQIHLKPNFRIVMNAHECS